MVTASKAHVAVLLLALLATATVAAPLTRGPGRRLMKGGRGGGGSWDGGIRTQDILSENDAIGGIENAVTSDQYAATYAATGDSYKDAFSATFPDNNNGEFWLNAAAQPRPKD